MTKNSHKKLKMLIVLGVLVALFAILTALSNNQQVCEFFATTVSRVWIAVFGTVFGALPFSAYELFLILAISGGVSFVVFVIIFIVKKRWQNLLSLVLAVAIAVMSFLNIYTLSATFAYNRNPLPEEIYTEYTSEDFTYDDAVALATTIVQQANNAYFNTEHDSDGNIVYPYSFREISYMLKEEYKRLDGVGNGYFSSYTPMGKRIANSWIMSQLHITGVFFAPFGEANVNSYENNLYLPTTLAHEMAHGKGVMREYQADLVAYYVCLTSENLYLRYGALASMASVALSLLYLYPNSSEIYSELYSALNSGITLEKQNYSRFYSQFTLVDDLGNFFNDIYLKLQKQEEGTNSYVKPGETQGTGQTDDDGKEIVRIFSFSGKENLLIHLYKQGLL